jgi:ribosomal protein S18 acetylase RimI-like enzyme
MVVNRDELKLHLVDLTVLPEFRNRGIGTQLIKRVINEARASQRCVQLEAQKGGRPRGLYHRLGFRMFEDTELFEFWEWKPDRPVA